MGERLMVMNAPGKEKEGKTEVRWMDCIENDLTKKGLSCEDAQDPGSLEATNSKR